MPDTTMQTAQLPALTYRDCVKFLKTVATERSEWAGIPMLVNDFDLVLEPRFPYQMKVCRNSDVNEAPDDGEEFVNNWFSNELMADVYVTRRNGKPAHYVRYHRGGRKGRKLIDDMLCSSAWLFEAEVKAMDKLRAMVKPHLFEAYCMTGSFLETSPRSKVTYLFRRLRPTLAVSGATGEMRILCALCLHPIGYYRDTHVGVMVPTDDVIAHLTYMRGDEHAFWKQANQHQPNDPNAAL